MVFDVTGVQTCALPILQWYTFYRRALGHLTYDIMFILHILSGEILLAAIPFTRLSHMIYAPFTRAYMGSEFGGVRHARDW
jgi:nitrate reductase gamma subunit